MTDELDTLLSPMQRRAIGESTGAINVWTGAISSGKTFSSLLRWLIFIATAPRGGSLVMIGRTRDSIARNALAPLQNPLLFGAVAQHVHYTRGAPMATILGREVEIIGANDAKAEPKVRGLTCAGAYVDELTTLPEAFWTMLMGRMRVPRSKIFATTNPDSPAHWLKARFLDRLGEPDMEHWRHWHFVMDDNPALLEEYKRQQKANYTGLFYRRFILGEWVAAEGAVFGMWDPDRHKVRWDDLPRMRRLLAVGVDYGTNNPTAALLLGLADVLDPRGTRLGSRLYLIDEWRTEMGHRLSDTELADRLHAWLASPHLPYETHLEPEWLFLDPSAASMKVEIAKRGTAIADADNDVLYGLALIASLLANDQLLVSDRCTGLISEFPGYSWDSKEALKGHDKPVKVADHSIDAARYALATTQALWIDQLVNSLPAAAVAA
jgi:PBSX family phage terminase large subunit